MPDEDDIVCGNNLLCKSIKDLMDKALVAQELLGIATARKQPISPSCRDAIVQLFEETENLELMFSQYCTHVLEENDDEDAGLYDL